MGLDNPLHIAFLVVILLLVFGARRLPEIGRSLGSGMREFKDTISGDSHEPARGATQATLAQASQQPPAPPAQAPVPAAQAPAPPQEAAQAFGAGAPEQPVHVVEPTQRPQ